MGAPALQGLLPRFRGLGRRGSQPRPSTGLVSGISGALRPWPPAFLPCPQHLAVASRLNKVP
eukprot:3433243-Alexandrium_andersonii.AAC.1